MHKEVQSCLHMHDGKVPAENITCSLTALQGVALIEQKHMVMHWLLPQLVLEQLR